jgi:hypothetical protein
MKFNYGMFMSEDSGAGSGGAGGDDSGAAASWIDAIPEDSRGFVENKGWKEPGDMLRSYQQLEQFMGADKAGRGVLLPKDEADTEGYNKIYAALGRPEKPDDYGLTEVLANEASIDPQFMGAMSGAMHSSGLSKKQAAGVARAYQEYYNSAQEAAAARHEQDVALMKQAGSPELIENSQRGFRFLGLEESEAMAIEMHFGVKRTTEMLAKIGQALGNDKFPAAASGSSFNGSPDAAKARIAELHADPAFRNRYLNGDPHAQKQMEDLFKKVAEKQ